MAAGSTQACGLTILRITVGIVFLVHGYQKLFHMGFHGVAGMFGHMGIPLPMISAVVVTLVEASLALTHTKLLHKRGERRQLRRSHSYGSLR